MCSIRMRTKRIMLLSKKSRTGIVPVIGKTVSQKNMKKTLVASIHSDIEIRFSAAAGQPTIRLLPLHKISGGDLNPALLSAHWTVMYLCPEPLPISCTTLFPLHQ